MDYDGNDFQAQNLQLAGEENSKFSPVLHPYALPKFDFDDGLHGHLRFDSLVENEVFLGIPSQEDNQWIEDFSRGNRGIEFSSSAAESCSISRHNNVWSEATSSESVEMLLKSVGQEEMVAGETIIEESDACDELSGLTERMEHHLKQDGKTKDVVDSKPALSPEERMEHVSKLNDGVCTSQPQEAEISIHGSLHELDPNVSSEIHGIIVIERMPGVKRKCDEANQSEHISVNESHDNTLPNDPSGLGMQIDYLDSSSLEAGVQVLDTWEPEHQVSENSFENANHLWVDTGKAAEEHRVLIKEADVDDQILNINAVKTDKNNLENMPCSSSEAASTQQYAVESSISYDEPSSLVLAGEGEPHIAKGCSEDLRSTDPEKASQCKPVDLSNVAEIHQQRRESTHADLRVTFEGDNNPERHALEDSNIKAEVPATSELKIDQTTPEENSLVEGKTHLQESDHHSYNEASVSYSEASMMPRIDNHLLDGQGNGIGSNYGGDLSSSTELLVEKHTIQNINGVDDAPGVPKKDSNAEVHASSPMVAGSMQTYGGNNVSNPNDVQYDQDVSFNEKENAKLPSPSSRMDCEIVEDIKQNNEIVHESECVTTSRNEPASNVGFEKTNLASHGTVDSLPLLSEYGAPVDQVTDHLDETKRTDDEGPKEPNLLSLKVSSKGANELHPLLELEKDAPHSSACKLSHEDIDQSLTVETCSSASGTDLSIELLDKIDQSASTVKTSDTASGSEQLVKANEASQNSSSKLEACPILYGSAVKEGSNSEGLLVPGNYEEAAMEKNHDVGSLRVAGEGGSADSVKLDCGTPTTSCIVLSLTGKEKEGVKESMGDCVSLSEFTFHSSSQNVGGANTTKDESSFTVVALPLAGLSERETSKDGQSTIQPIIVEGSPSTPSMGLLDPKVPPSGGSKGTPERKTRRTSRATGKENAKRGKHKETTPSRQSDRGDKSCSVSVSLAGTGQLVQFEGLRPFGIVESSGTIPCVVSIPTSNLPDLNASSPPSALFRQPFTDLQQVELRAQIFVYGSLIQGAAPDEACMVSAFGASDGGRSVWEPVWRACMERIQGQKSHPNNPETPVQQRSESRYAGARPPDQSIKRGANKSKVALSPLGQASSKGTPSPVVNSMIPLSSPLWNISTPDGLQSSGMQRTGLLDYPQPLPPLRPFQTPTTRGFVGHNASWLSQTPFPGPWVASSQTSAFDANARFSLLPTTETVKLTPVKESSAPISSGTKFASPSTLVHKEGPSVGETSSLSGMKEIAIVPGQNSTDLKPRKRKKVTVSEDLGRNSLLSLTKTESVSAPVATSHLSTSVIVSTPTFFASKTDASKIVTAVTPTPFTDHPKRGEQNSEQKDIISDETFSKVEDAKRQAEDAAALAAGAVSHSQSVWSQLHKHKNSGLTPDAQTKLASAAVAVAAAASVAKAAAAAAKIASNAALQAKLMADEALISSSRAGASSLPDMHNLGNTTAASILMGGNGGNCSSSVIVAAREAARRRVEAASAASQQAENLDAILKAAELAAEAVSQAGKIVAMGDPLPLNELVEAGPEGYWRIPQVLPKQGVIPNKDNREPAKADGIEDGQNIPDRHAKDGPSEEANTKNRGLPPLSREFSRESIESEVSKEPMEDHLRAEEGISGSFTTSLTNSRVKRSRRASDLAKTIVPESEIGSRSASITDQEECEKVVGTVKESIKEGSLVEVCKVGDGFKTAWFSANVLSCKDGKAFVCYTELHSDEGSGMLREWVALEGEASSAPRVRIAHPMTTMQSEGARKRRRAAMGDYAWSVGDRVDVWMQNCWREGVVAEKNQKDDTTLTVHFPAEGEMSVAKVWHLRPTLIWKDGEWIEWSSLRGKIPSSQGDTPQEKRLKLGVPAIKGGEKDKISKNIEVPESRKTDESQLLPLSGNEKVFNVGKSTGDQNKPNSLRTIQAGLQKEGSRVIVGVPKPGKKRKFMEVSKHYVAERSIRTNEPNDSVKFAKYLMPQGSGPRGWNNTKIVPKEKQVAESKTKSGKSHSVSGRTLIQKDTVLTSALSAQNDGVVVDQMSKDSGSTDENVSAQQGLMKFASFSNTEGGAEGPVLFSSRALPSDAPSKKTSTLNAKSERVDTGKLPPSGGKSAKVEVKEKFTSGDPGKSNLEVAEPRRSNRRIQPTSRLLEGLQSSLIISKIPAVSHDKSHRSQNRATSKGKNHG